MPEISVVHGSVIEQDVEYIVNAANTMMRGGGGIDGVIHRLAGPKLLLELQRVAPNGCRTGEVVVTGAHNLPHKGIVHTPGPRWKGGSHGEAGLLAASYRSSLQAVDSLGGKSIAFCSISTGAYRFPIDLAADIAIRTVRDWAETIRETGLELVVFSMYREEEFAAFQRALASEQNG